MSDALQHPLQFDELDVLEQRTGLRYELWHGQAYAMTGGTPAHNLIALGLYSAIKPQLASECRAFVADVGLRLDTTDDSNKAYPDLMVVCHPKPEPFQTEPLLLAEVLSDSSVSRDRITKLKAYRALPSLQAYLILAQTAVEIEVYRRANLWRKELFHGGDAVIELSQPALRLPLRTVYADVWQALAADLE